MPHVICPHCTTPTVLPDPWPHPGYTCPRCGTTVPIVVVYPPTPPAEDDLQFDTDAPISRRARRVGMDSPASTGFSFGFGQEAGKFAFNCLLALVVFGFIAGIVGFGLVMHFSQK